LAVEDRIKAAVLADGGLDLDQVPRPELDCLHYLPWIKIPVLMLNGEHDDTFPPVESQEPMFQLLGTPAEHKRHLLFKGSHVAIPLAERVQETLNWFDRYLGPVQRKGDSTGGPE
jgi:pimeloyl-ACP methyl ester carboxylesterase